MKTYWTAVVKPQILQKLNEANITGDAAKAILKYERAITTLQNNYYRGMSWDALWNTDTSINAYNVLETLNANGGWIDSNNPPKYFEEWKRYCDVNGYVYDCDISDALA